MPYVSPYRTLIAYSGTSTFTQTTLDYLSAFADYLPSQVEYLHVTHNAHLGVDFELEQYDVIINSYCARFSIPDYVSNHFSARLRDFGGLKIIAVQDEYENTNQLKKSIAEHGFHVVLTCVPQDHLDYVFPKHEFPEVRFITVLTGYVPPSFGAGTTAPRPLQERPITIGYRGRDIGGLYGRLGFDKYEIGRRMKEVCEQRGIRHDIAVDDASRIYGLRWLEFIGSCRSVLGTESASNVFDFDNTLRRRFDAMTEASGGRRPSYEEFAPFTAELEQQISMGQISPRIFESALMRTPMVLFPGRYSDIIAPDRHYIALERDFSNIDDVLARIERLDELEAMADRAYNDLIASEKFGYASFIKVIDEVIGDLLPLVSAAPSEKMGARPPTDEYGLLANFFQRPTPRPLPANIVNAQIRFAILEPEIKGLLAKKDEELSSHRSGFDRLNQRIYAVVLHPDALTQEMSSAVADYGKLIDEAHRDFDRLDHLASRAFADPQGLALQYGTLGSLNEELLARLKTVYQACERMFTSYHSAEALIMAHADAAHTSQPGRRRETMRRGVLSLSRLFGRTTFGLRRKSRTNKE